MYHFQKYKKLGNMRWGVTFTRRLLNQMWTKQVNPHCFFSNWLILVDFFIFWNMFMLLILIGKFFESFFYRKLSLDSSHTVRPYGRNCVMLLNDFNTLLLTLSLPTHWILLGFPFVFLSSFLFMSFICLTLTPIFSPILEHFDILFLNFHNPTRHTCHITFSLLHFYCYILFGFAIVYCIWLICLLMNLFLSCLLWTAIYLTYLFNFLI